VPAQEPGSPLHKHEPHARRTPTRTSTRGGAARPRTSRRATQRAMANTTCWSTPDISDTHLEWWVCFCGRACSSTAQCHRRSTPCAWLGCSSCYARR
jgi:hypothetical protein